MDERDTRTAVGSTVYWARGWYSPRWAGDAGRPRFVIAFRHLEAQRLDVPRSSVKGMAPPADEFVELIEGDLPTALNRRIQHAPASREMGERGNGEGGQREGRGRGEVRVHTRGKRYGRLAGEVREGHTM